MFIVFLNGPAKVGKTTIGNQLQKKYPELYVCKNMADPLKAAVHTLLQLSENELKQVERMKDMKFDLGDGSHTFRQLYIKMSEDYLKPLFGSEVFGHLMVRSIINDLSIRFGKVVVICDCGFTAETRPLLKMFNPNKCMLIQLCGQDLNFDGDSRSYISGLDFSHHHVVFRKENNVKHTLNYVHNHIKTIFNI